MPCRSGLDPIPLQECVSLDFTGYPEMPEYFGVPQYQQQPYYHHYPLPNHQYGWKVYEPIAPHENDILLGR